MKDAILAYNAGSSSIKFALFSQEKSSLNMQRLCSGSISDIGGSNTVFSINDDADTVVATKAVKAHGHEQALHLVMDWMESKRSDWNIVAAGHRVVHGGTEFTHPVLLDEGILSSLMKLIPLAPLHQPQALQAIDALTRRYPHLPQVACFDTAFHVTMPTREYRLPLPDRLLREGIRRYGFHGLSYESITRTLPTHLGDIANTKVVIAHLGHGVSMCAVQSGRSIATTMGFTPLDGLPMGRRSGSIDPAIVLYLLKHGMAEPEIAMLLHKQSGLLGLSGISDDMRTLLESNDAAAAEAVDIFCYRVSRELGSLAAALGGLDAVVFTGGIGTYAAPVRERVCHAASWLGIELDASANNENSICITKPDSPVSAWTIPTDEERVIAHHTTTFLADDACPHSVHSKGDRS